MTTPKDKTPKERITKDEFYKSGGFSNPNLCRIMRGKKWIYYKLYVNAHA